MFSLAYDFFLFLFFLFKLPFLLYDYFFLKKKKSGILKRLKTYHFNIPENKEPILIHAVSVGEVKAASLLIRKIKAERENLYIVLSTMTETGYEEAANVSLADERILCPFDFFFVMRKFMQKLKPKAVVFIESDFWYHMALCGKQMHAKIFALSAKMSPRSAKNYSRAFFFSKRLFGLFDLIGVQSESYKDSFILANADVAKIMVTGNLKFENPAKTLSKEKQHLMKTAAKDKIIVTAASTHSNEEEKIIDIFLRLKNRGLSLMLILAPRHPERFSEVENILKSKDTKYCKFSELPKPKKSPDIVLVNRMGMLDSCYSISSLAVVGGSFVDGIGGHNILEPVHFNIPVFFGPYSYAQKPLVEKVFLHHAGESVDIVQLEEKIFEYFTKGKSKEKLLNGVQNLNQSSSQILENTYLAISGFLD